ncbi:fucose isomerase, partial [Klebsiella pneumoniae]|nr:fucose isomerase [Klebsiella pneumoniae]
MSRIPQQLTMGVIIGNRGFFPSYLVAEAREQAVALFSRLGINTIMLDPSQTELGGVETRQDAKICAELFRSHRDNIHGVVVLLPNFGDEKAI